MAKPRGPAEAKRRKPGGKVPMRRTIGVRDVRCGSNVVISECVNLYECKIGNDTAVGPFVEIQRGVVIGMRCKIQSHVFVCEKVSIGDDCFVGHGVMFINDRFRRGAPAKGDVSLWEATVIGNRVSIGSNATLLPCRVCDDVVIGAGAVVTRDISLPGIYAGNPARLLRTL